MGQIRVDQVRLNHPYLRIVVLEGETMLINYYMSLIILAENLIVFTITSWYYYEEAPMW